MSGETRSLSPPVRGSQVYHWRSWNSSRAVGFCSITEYWCQEVLWRVNFFINSILLSCSALLPLVLISSCCKIPVNHHRQFSVPWAIVQLGLIFACEWIVGFQLYHHVLAYTFFFTLEVKRWVPAPEVKEEEFSPQYSHMCTSAHEPQTCKQLSWLASWTASLYCLWHWYYLLEQCQFQWMFLIYCITCVVFPLGLLVYTCPGWMFSPLLVPILRYFVGPKSLSCSCCISHLSIAFGSLCLQGLPSALVL